MANNTDTLLGVLTPILEAAAPEDLPLLLASLERLAALKYEAWAEEASDAYEKAGLLDCAARERAIADFLESLDPNSAAKLAALQAQFPNASSLYDSIMDGQSRQEQFRRQAAGELGGADFLRQFRASHSGAIAAQFEALALGEEANSTFLTVLADHM
ncbi:MAG: hypothetical protein ACI9ON_004194 [Limisphaerales bacterium]|jgi:hypothetical protein